MMGTNRRVKAHVDLVQFDWRKTVPMLWRRRIAVYVGWMGQMSTKEEEVIGNDKGIRADYNRPVYYVRNTRRNRKIVMRAKRRYKGSNT